MEVSTDGLEEDGGIARVSHCTIPEVLPEKSSWRRCYRVPILSESVAHTDTSLGGPGYPRNWKLAGCGLSTRSARRNGGPKILDCLVIAPCQQHRVGWRWALRILSANGSKAQLRNGRPVVIVFLPMTGSRCARNIGMLQARKNVYFIPYGQDDPAGSLLLCITHE